MRRECLDHLLVLGEAHLRRVLREYASYFNGAWPHQGMRQHIPDGTGGPVVCPETDGKIQTIPVLGGPHYAYIRAA